MGGKMSEQKKLKTIAEEKVETEQKSNPTPKKIIAKKKEEPGYDKKYSTYSGRISYPATYSAPLKKLSKDMKKTIKQLYTIAVKDFLLKHNCLPSSNNNKRS